jgi:hypothetical protein
MLASGVINSASLAGLPQRLEPPFWRRRSLALWPSKGRNTNFVAVSLIGHGALRAGATIWNQTELLAVLAPWPLLRVFFLHGSVKPGVLTATQPQDALEVNEQHFDFCAIVQDCSRIPWVR